ncbi:hypothetical protein B0H14DRAFT_859448 [Mycena olivaceomarginata]|nr:hypothetical protein B0H14DRAFT_859448 [Mycena olivaceomarginata]
MRLMYHRQALNIIRQNRCSPLSTTILETYSSYFPWDYVLLSTKTAILSELANRTLSSGVEAPEVEARAVADSPVLLYIVQMLVWPEPAARIWSCRLLGNLASHESAVPAVLDAQPCERLLCLLRDSLVVDMAIDALSEIAQQKTARSYWEYEGSYNDTRVTQVGSSEMGLRGSGKTG